MSLTPTWSDTPSPYYLVKGKVAAVSLSESSLGHVLDMFLIPMAYANTSLPFTLSTFRFRVQTFYVHSLGTHPRHPCASQPAFG